MNKAVRGHPVCLPEDDGVWRVEIGKTGEVKMEYIGLYTIDYSVTRLYDTLEQSPDWVQDRIAILNMMPPDPNKSVVFNVGRRVDENTYWIVQ